MLWLSDRRTTKILLHVRRSDLRTLSNTGLQLIFASTVGYSVMKVARLPLGRSTLRTQPGKKSLTGGPERSPVRPLLSNTDNGSYFRRSSPRAVFKGPKTDWLRMLREAQLTERSTITIAVDQGDASQLVLEQTKENRASHRIKGPEANPILVEAAGGISHAQVVVAPTDRRPSL